MLHNRYDEPKRIAWDVLDRKWMIPHGTDLVILKTLSMLVFTHVQFDWGDLATLPLCVFIHFLQSWITPLRWYIQIYIQSKGDTDFSHTILYGNRIAHYQISIKHARRYEVTTDRNLRRPQKSYLVISYFLLPCYPMCFYRIIAIYDKQ